MPLTPDAIPTNEQLRESLADRFYHPHKKIIWLGGLVLFLGIVAFLGVREFQKSRQEEMWSRFLDISEIYTPNAHAPADPVAARKQLDQLDVLLKDYPDDTVTPFALQHKVLAQTGAGDYEGALKTLDELRTRYRDFPFVTLPADPDSSGRARSLAGRLEDTIQREQKWAAQRAYVHHWPSEERLALVETTVGSFWLGFYDAENEAPKHVESFIRHAKAGDYNGTQVYAVFPGVDGAPERFEAGSAESGLSAKAVRDPSLYDRDDPTDTIESEDSRTTIHHVYRVVSSARMDSGESGSRFVVVARRNGFEKMNGEYTPFAAVMDREKSLETIDRIGRAQTYATNPDTAKADGTYRMRDTPYPPIYIRRVSLWTKEKLEDGHTWDVSRAGRSDQPEPWEKTRTAPRPEEFVEKKDETPPKKEGTPPTPPKDGK